MRLTAFGVSFCLLAALACGCAPSSTGTGSGWGGMGGGSTGAKTAPWGAGGGKSTGSGDGVKIDPVKTGTSDPSAAEAIPDKPAAGAPPPRPAAAAEAMTGTDRMPPVPKPDDSLQLRPGTLTAGSFDDLLDPKFFASFARKLSQDRRYGDLPGRLGGDRLLLLVKDQGGGPVGNARVRVASGRDAAVDLITRTDGRVVVLPAWDGLASGPLTVTVTPPDGGPPVTETVPAGSNRWEVTLPSARSRPPRELDLAIVLDTTGSMGDELSYLKAEIKGIAEAVHAKFPEVNQRFGLVLYRDDGDEYVTRRFDFTTSLDEFRTNLGAQSAAGGGDTPEAMHRGVEEALQLRWREGDGARIMFLIGDAPPHDQHLARTMNAVNGLRKKGVSVYPVACSGYDDPAEFVFRGAAVLTGAEFLFLTDDSGVGAGHAEPHIPFFHVQKLDKLMVRMIAGELTGRRVEPQRGEIIRTVGKPPN